jgi:hypothetical protein
MLQESRYANLVRDFILTPLLVGLALGLAWLIYLRSRVKHPDFWKLVARKPDQAYEWFVSHDGWVVVEFDTRHHQKPRGTNVEGPFILRVPKLGGKRVAVYGLHGLMEESQEAFIQFFGARGDE